MTDERKKQLMTAFGMPDNQSLKSLIEQVANEVAQECGTGWCAPAVPVADTDYRIFRSWVHQKSKHYGAGTTQQEISAMEYIAVEIYNKYLQAHPTPTPDPLREAALALMFEARAVIHNLENNDMTANKLKRLCDKTEAALDHKGVN